MLSIIIPTKNEEKYLPKLLSLIKKQTFGDFEIIIADASSTDNTLKIARDNGCKIIKGGLPAFGKNEGAKKAEGDVLFFLDADVFLPHNFFEKSLKEFKEKKADIASFCILPDSKNKIHSYFFDAFYNAPILFLEKILPHAATGILIKKDLFFKLKGFDQTITLAEDHDLARRANSMANYAILRSNKIFISPRRFEKEGWVRTGLKYLFCEMYMIFKGPMRSKFINYRYDYLTKNNKK